MRLAALVGVLAIVMCMAVFGGILSQRRSVPVASPAADQAAIGGAVVGRFGTGPAARADDAGTVAGTARRTRLGHVACSFVLLITG